MLKSYGWGGVGGWVAHVILVSAQGPNTSFFFFGGTFIRLGGLFGQGLGLGPGLDNLSDIVLIHPPFGLALVNHLITLRKQKH